MKTRKILLTTILSLTILTGCGTKTCNITFHQDEGNKNDVFEYKIGKTTYMEVKTFQDNISINERRGYDVSWEDYDLSTIESDYTVNALYTLHEYTITYKYEERVIGTVKYTIESSDEDVKAKAPDLPTTAGYIYEYEDYSISGKAQDFVVYATRSLASYTITFVDINDVPVADPIPFNINTESIDEPEVPAIEGKDGVWEEYELDAKNIIVHPIYSTHYYYASFWNKEGEDKELVDVVKFVSGDTSIEEPALPLSSDYRDGYWGEYTLGEEDIDIYPVYTDYHVFTAKYKKAINDSAPIIVNFTYETRNQKVLDNEVGYTSYWKRDNVEYRGGDDIEYPMCDLTFVKSRHEPHQYTITLDPGKGSISGDDTITISYGSLYQLEDATREDYNFTGWYTEDGTLISSSGVWNFAEDVSLKAKFVSKLIFDFEDGEVPTDITIKQNVESLTIDEDDILKANNKVLKITIAASGDYGVYFSKNYLDKVFADEDVVAINFDAKASSYTSNFRAKIGGANLTYEANNGSYSYGLNTEWKKFSFKRAYYDAYVEGDSMIYGGGLSAGSYVLVDNVAPVTSDLDSYGFENGSYREANKAYFSSGHDDASRPTFYVPTVQILKLNNSDVSHGFSYDIKSEGNRSFTFEKNNGYFSLSLSKDIKDSLGENGFVTFDLYFVLDVPDHPEIVNIRSDANVKNLGMGANDGNGRPITFSQEDVYFVYGGRWNTLTIPSSGITADGRFLQINGSTAGNYYIDNIKVVTAA